jgi:hypothetical protein
MEDAQASDVTAPMEGWDQPTSRRNTMNRNLRLLLTLGTLLALGNGCADFSTQATGDSLTTITFDDRLPGAFEEVFDTCVTPFGIAYGDESTDLLGSCSTIFAGASSEAITLWAALVLNREVTLDIPLRIYEERDSFSDFPFPLQSCYVRWDTEVYFESVSFEDFSADWVTRGGKPALRFAFENPAYSESSNWYFNPAYASTIASVNCNRLWQEALVLGYLNDSGINGLADLGFSDPHTLVPSPARCLPIVVVPFYTFGEERQNGFLEGSPDHAVGTIQKSRMRCWRNPTPVVADNGESMRCKVRWLSWGIVIALMVFNCTEDTDRTGESSADPVDPGRYRHPLRSLVACDPDRVSVFPSSRNAVG